MAWDDKDTANIVVNMTIMVATVVTAWATSRQLGLYRRSLAVSAPTVSGNVDGRDRSGPHPLHVSLILDEEHVKAWRLSSITVWLPWRPLISEIGGAPQNEYGNTRWYEPKRWVRRLTFDPPIQRIGLVVPSDVPALLKLRCELVSRADPKVKSHCVVRIKTID